MSWSLTRERHAHGSRRGGKAKAVIKTVSNGGQAARCPLIKVTAASQGVTAGATASVGVCNCCSKPSKGRSQGGTKRAAASESQGRVGRLGRALREEGAALRVAAQRVVAIEGAGSQVVTGLLGLGLGLLGA